jgi:hypothetical protein
MMAALAMMRNPGDDSGPANKILRLITNPGEMPADLVRLLEDRYGSDRGLTLKSTGLDAETFGRLDANRDGVLDAKELESFVRRHPDVEFTIRLGSDAGVVQAPDHEISALSRHVKLTEGVAVLDMGLTRAELRAGEDGGNGLGFIGGIVKQQIAAQFRRADPEGKGYLDEQKANGLFRGLFKAMDRDGDGKLTLKEVNAYFDAADRIQAKATSGTVTLTISDQSRGLFDLLDVNHDGRLSVREMRGAVRLLEKFDRQGKGYITKEDVPREYKLTVRPGSGGGASGPQAAFAALYGGNRAEPERELKAGPLWFRRMDRNRDGDVSRKEWIFSEELFRKIDTDGDGLISVEEAERYEALTRKQK